MGIKVSFISTVKNAEIFIGSTINSISNQSLKNWEMIIVDDGSTDNTLNIIKEIASRESRIKLIETGGVGRGRALNIAIDSAQGEYIANIDSDDPSHPQRAEIESFYLDKYKQFSLVCSDSHYIEGKTNKIDWELFLEKDFKAIVKNVSETKEKPFRKEPINHSSVMFRKYKLIEIGGYDEKRNYQFDADLWLRFALENEKIGLIPLKLSSKRMHANQSYEMKNRKKYLISALDINNKVIREFNLSKKYYLKNYMKYVYGYLPKKIRKKIKILFFS